MKQDHLAAIAGVCQTTVSRWEAGTVAPDPAVADRLLRSIGPAAQGDAALRRLVGSSRSIVHLITDIDHRLLAASPAREAAWGAAASDFAGESLWRFATPAIVEAERGLVDLGWWDTSSPPAVRVETGAGGAPWFRIDPGVMLWERVWLADGTPARLCTMLA